MVRKHRSLSLALVVGVLGLVSCTSTTPVASPTHAPTRTATTPPPTPTPSDDPVVAEVKATIIGYYKDGDYLRQHPEDPDMTKIQRWTTGESVDSSVKEVLMTRQNGLLEGYTVVRDIRFSGPAEDKGAGPEITVVYCVDTSNGKIVRQDGSIWRPEPAAIENTAVLRLTNNKWLIDTGRNGDAKPC